MTALSVRPVDTGGQRYFDQYLLPQTALEVRRDSGSYTVLGALTGTLACGAAAVRWEDGSAVLESLFIDPLARGQGLGGALADLAAAKARERGAADLRCGYVLDGAELAAMNAIFSRRGGAPQPQGPAYCADMSYYREARLIGSALRSGYRPSPNLLPFSRLTPEQRDRLAARTDIPGCGLAGGGGSGGQLPGPSAGPAQPLLVPVRRRLPLLLLRCHGPGPGPGAAPAPGALPGVRPNVRAKPAVTGPAGRAAHSTAHLPNRNTHGRTYCPAHAYPMGTTPAAGGHWPSAQDPPRTRLGPAPALLQNPRHQLVPA